MKSEHHKNKIRKRIEELIQERNKLRKEKKFYEADMIREGLRKSGIILEDNKDETSWSRKL